MSDLKKVKELRKATGAGFKDCNNALKEANGDLQKSIEILRVKGISKASKKMSREANEGLVALSGDEKSTSVIEINCETDFVAKNEDFIKFVQEISEINHKVMSNKDKLLKEIMENGDTVENNLPNLITKIGEKITIGRCKSISIENSTNYTYMHSTVKDNLAKLAVITSISSTKYNEKIRLFGKQLAMHVAATNPLAINSENINTDLLEKEKQLISEELKKSGKNDDIVLKISEGKLKKFKEENSLMTQQWVMDPKKKVKDIISDEIKSDLVINDFFRLKIGE